MSVVPVRYQWTFVRCSKGDLGERALKIRWPIGFVNCVFGDSCGGVFHRGRTHSAGRTAKQTVLLKSGAMSADSHLVQSRWSSPPVALTAAIIIIMSFGDNPHLLLGRIRFLNSCIECFKNSEPLPESLYYVPKEVCYKICKDSSTSSSSGPSGGGSIGGKTLIAVYENPNQTPHKKLCKYNIEPKKGACIRTTGDEYRNSQGLWVKMTKVSVSQLFFTSVSQIRWPLGDVYQSHSLTLVL